MNPRRFLRKYLAATATLVVTLTLSMLTDCKPVGAPVIGLAATETSVKKPLRMGAYFWPGSFWMDVAWKKGWFREAGLNVERVDTNADYFGSFDDLISGELDTVGFTLFDLILSDANGNDLVGVINSDISFGADALVARKGIASLRGLKGKKIGVPKGTYLEFMIELIAHREGMRINDFQLVDVAAESGPSELISGRVDAVMSWEPLTSAAVAGSKGKRLYTTADIPGVSGGLFAFRRKFIEDRPDDVQRFVRVWNRTTEFIAANKADAYAIVAELNGKSIAEVRFFASTDKILDLHANKLAFSYASGFNSMHGIWRQMNDFMLEHGLVKTRVDSQRFIDVRFLMGL